MAALGAVPPLDEVTVAGRLRPEGLGTPETATAADGVRREDAPSFLRYTAPRETAPLPRRPDARPTLVLLPEGADEGLARPDVAVTCFRALVAARPSSETTSELAADEGVVVAGTR